MKFNHNCRKHFDKHWISEAVFKNGPKLVVDNLMVVIKILYRALFGVLIKIFPILIILS